jgi:putative peptide zinc metalloprotease protein
VPRRETHEKVQVLKPWVRVVVTLWVLMVIPVIAFSVTMAVIGLPRILATAADSASVQYHGMTKAFSQHRYMGATAGALATFAVALPAASVSYMFLRTCRRVVRGSWRLTNERPALRAAIVPLYGVLALGLAWLWWPNGEYHKLERHERWTVQDTVRRARHVANGRPGVSAGTSEIAPQTTTTVAPTTSTTEKRATSEDEKRDTRETTSTTVERTTATSADTTETTSP